MRTGLHVVVLAALLAWVTGPPAGQTVDAAPTPTFCGGYTIRIVKAETRDLWPITRVDILRRGRVVETASESQVSQVRCAEVTGDGRPDLVVELYSGGMHCCATIQVFQLRPRLRRTLDYPAGNALGFSLARDRAGRPGRVLGDDGLAYYDDLCFACSPSSLPLVACFRGTRFADCTGEFPTLLQAAANDYTQALRDADRSSHDSRVAYMRGAALGVYAAHVLLGREADGLAAVRRVTTEPDVVIWLSRQRPGVMAWRANRAGRLMP